MKYLNFAFIGFFALMITSCGEQSKSQVVNDATELAENTMDAVEDAVDSLGEEEDAYDYLESALVALEDGNTTLAASEIVKSIAYIKNSLDGTEENDEAKEAVMKLTEISNSLKAGTKMTSDNLETELANLSYFSYEDFGMDDDDALEDEEDYDDDDDSEDEE